MANGSSDNRTPIIVAVITVVGTVSVGLLANWDKLFRQEASADRAGAQAIGSAAPSPETERRNAAEGSSAAVDHAGNPPSPTLPSSPPAFSSPSLPPGDVMDSGRRDPSPAIGNSSVWQDALGYTYVVILSGTSSRGTIYKGGMTAGHTEGTIRGAQVNFHFVNRLEGREGDCSGQVSPDGASMAGTCSSNLGPFDFNSERQR